MRPEQTTASLRRWAGRSRARHRAAVARGAAGSRAARARKKRGVLAPEREVLDMQKQCVADVDSEVTM
jgi:hypothetical protein